MSLPVATSVTGVLPLTRFAARVEGERALALLHDTTTANLAGLRPGEGALTCYLDDKGRLLAELRVTVSARGVIVDGEQAGRAAVLERLARIAPLSGCSIEPLEAGVTAMKGADAPGANEHDCADTPDGVLVRTWYGADLIGDAIEGPAWDTFEAERIAAGIVRFGVDVTEGMLVNETPLLARAVSASKGCYPGQESVARVRNLGSIRRHHVQVSLDGEVEHLPRALTLDGDEVGMLTSAAGGLGIAFVRATVGPGVSLRVDDLSATVGSLLTEDAP